MSLAQNLDWEISISNSEQFEQINDFILTPENEFLFVGEARPPGFAPRPRMFKTDSLGNIIWFKQELFDTANFGIYSFIELINDSSDFSYIGGSVNDTFFNKYYDFVSKIDFSGDTIWTKRFPYFSLYNTVNDAAVLNDKSIVTVGEILTASDLKMIARRIDSLGNVIWERIYADLPIGSCQDVLDPKDGSLIFVLSSTPDLMKIYRTDYNGVLVDTAELESINSTINGRVLNNHSTINTRNNILITLNIPNGNNRYSNIFEISPEFQIIDTVLFNNVASVGPVCSIDSSHFLNFIDLNNQSFAVLSNDFSSFLWDSTYSSQIGLYHSARSHYMIHDDIYLGGIDNSTSSDGDYWFAKVSNVGKEWQADPCILYPPIANFLYSYDYPLLKLEDSSFSGLDYLDTIYTWNWIIDGIQSGNEDNISIFLDTVINKTIDIELIISNWYGCFDTVTTTLDFTSTAIQELRDPAVTVYPNPSDGRIFFENNDAVSGNIRFYSLDGSKIKRIDFDSKEDIIEMKLDSKGLFFYRVITSRGIQTGKLIIE